ncbi:gas vesicle protein [Streptomyces mashuensis]|uniref:Gas vesicle protein n=1 Tax=Streptomyces mashuensis TaxID=33904 RepID=A0A919B7M4_9ACTN|nr:GvpL/GvpF family gas vesicle protein [Streptomyces mashuensis]GHF59999.1 gas vesicle protein [Streptomyces mashuensis]
MNTTELLYAYAVTQDAGDLGEALETVTGVAGEPVRAVRQAGLAALAGPVPAAGFDEAALRASLEDLGWLERTARAHQRVVDAAAAAAPCVLPLRLATVYRDEDGLRRMLTERGQHLRAALGRLDGRCEWGVKVYTLPPRAAPAGPSAGAPPAPVRSGRDYLRRRAAERTTRREEEQRVDEAARTLHATLATLAEDTRLYPPQNPRLSRQPGRNVLNAAYLVPREQGPRFTDAVARLAEAAPADGVGVELTGPWAPYSFVTPAPP